MPLGTLSFKKNSPKFSLNESVSQFPASIYIYLKTPSQRALVLDTKSQSQLTMCVRSLSFHRTMKKKPSPSLQLDLGRICTPVQCVALRNQQHTSSVICHFSILYLRNQCTSCIILYFASFCIYIFEVIFFCIEYIVERSLNLIKCLSKCQSIHV